MLVKPVDIIWLLKDVQSSQCAVEPNKAVDLVGPLQDEAELVKCKVQDSGP